VPFRQRRLFIHGVTQLRHRLGFAGQRRLGHLGAVRRQHAGIGGDAIACLEQQDIARHQFRRLDQAHLAIAPHARRRRQHVLERRQRGFGAVLLDKAERGIEQHDHTDHDRILDIPDRAGKYRGAEQDQDQQALELVEELEPGRTWCSLGQAIRSVVGQALSRRVPGQAIHGIGFQAVDGLVGG